jgi:hypothetical protein
LYALPALPLFGSNTSCLIMAATVEELHAIDPDATEAQAAPTLGYELRKNMLRGVI